MALPSDQPMPQVTEKPTGALNSIPVQVSKSGVPTLKNIQLGPDETKDILAQMQQMVSARQTVDPNTLLFSGGPTYNTIQNSLKDMAAWASGGIKGPTEGLALRDAEKAREAKDLFEMRTQMAAYQSAQKQAKATADRIAANLKPGEGGAASAGMTYGGIPVPMSVQAQIKDLNPTQQDAYLNEWLKTLTTETVKSGLNPASLDLKDAIVYNPTTKSYELKQVNLADYNDLKAKGYIKNASELYEDLPSATKAPSTPTGGQAAPEAENVLPQLQKAVFSTESSSGKADTTKPGVQGAIGPMQITPDTFDTAKRLKLIPSEYSIGNPEQNKEAGNKLLEYYYNKYDKSPDKTLAAYIGGEGAINKDGSINYDRKDALGTTIGTYIDINKAKAGLRNDLTSTTPGVQVASTGKTGLPDISKIKAEQEANKEKLKVAAQEAAKTAEIDRKDFKINTNPDTLVETEAMTKRVQKLVKEFPQIAGVINKADYMSAVAGVLEEGIGPVSVKGLQTAIFKTLPDTGKESLAARNELAQYLARMELQAAKLIKGQGQITEGEREILRRASASLDDPAELLYKKSRILERANQKNKDLAAIYGAGENFADFEKFSQDKEFKKVMANYRADLNNIMDEKFDFRKLKPGAQPAKPQHPADIQDLINKSKKAP